LEQRISSIEKAKEKALRLLDYRPRSSKEIERRLMKAGFEEEVVAETLRRLEEVGFIDDAEFARMWINHRKAVGKTRIKWELRQKGVSTEVVEEALSGIDPETEYQSAMKAARARWAKDKSPDERTRRRRLAAHLQRKGFGWDVINSVLNELSGEPD
jgi:regulatory protein